MSINRSLGLMIKLSGEYRVKSKLFELQNDALTLQKILSNLTINPTNVASNLDKQFTQSLNNTISNVRAKGSQLKQEIQKATTQTDTSVFNNQRLPAVIPTSIRSYTPPITNKGELQVINQAATKYKQLFNDRINYTNGVYENEKVNLKKMSEYASTLIQTGFGLHIAQIYIAPIVYALEQITAKMVEAFSEFDKKYTSYMVKSEEFGEYLSKGDFYEASIGQVYGLQDAAIAAERFAASGVDVAKSQDALVAVMQVATAADMDYAEAANGVIKTMQAMHMEVTDTTEITDALINSANESTAELSDLVQWFEYSASSAYQMGLNVQQLSAYLGILASSGTPNTGAAMRQLFLQLSKEDIQKNIKGKFGQITDEDFQHVDKFISKMREYVKTSGDEKAATLEITRLLGGKANAQQALQNLLVAEPELWNRVNNAVNKTGSTQDLYNKITDNSADAIAKIKVNLNILLTQLGETFGPFLKVAASALTGFTSVIVALPKWFKVLLSLLIITVTAFASIVFVILGAVGAISILSGIIIKLNIHEKLITASTHSWAFVLRQLLTELYTVTIAGTSYGNMLRGITTSTTVAATATQTLTNKQLILNSVTWGLGGAFVGYMASSALMQKSMYSEAYVVGHLTAMWLAYSAARAASVFGPVASMGAALAVGTAYEAIMYNQIETMKNDAFNASLAKQTGLSSTINKNTTVNIANANISSDGMDIEDLVTAMDVDYDE